MLKLEFIILFLFLAGGHVSANPAKNFHGLKALDIDGKPRDLKEFNGKVVLVVNTASECGYTPQYEGLEELYKKYKAKGFYVLGFPSNDYGAQEPGSNEEIKNFCTSKFHVTFPMFSKDAVKGEKKQPVYQWLTSQKGYEGEVGWNFEKFLIDKKGNIVARYKSSTKPLDAELTQKIESSLSQK